MAQIRELTANRLKVKIFENRLEMGAGAADDVCEEIRALQAGQQFVNIIFAAAPSQNEFLSSLSTNNTVDWSRINAFHMDEYIGLAEKAPQSFGQFLKGNIFDKVPFHEVHYLDGNAVDKQAECRRYASLLEQYPVDIVCMGIGENTHIAFNDPHDANFNDPLTVKTVSLDEVSRQQQVNDGCFASIEQVPLTAITVTIPALLRAKRIYCVVPGSKKTQAVFHTLNSEVKEDFPSTVLRKHNRVILYLDRESAAGL